MGDISTSMYMNIYYKGLAPRIQEAQKLHSLLSASWRLRKAAGAVQRPESWRACGVDASSRLKAWAQVHWAGEDGCPGPTARQRESQASLPPPFQILREALRGRGDAHPPRESLPLLSVCLFKC